MFAALLFFLQSPDGLPIYVTGGSVVVAASALLAVGAMRERVKGMGRTLARHSHELSHRVTRDEFSLMCSKIDAVHEDVREIRRKMP